MTRILIIRFSSLGDIILTFPSLEVLARRQTCEIHYLTKKSFAPLVELRGLTHKVHTISDHASFHELFNKVKELKQLGFDEVYDLHHNLRSWMVVFFLRKKTKRIRKFRFQEIFLFVFKRKFFLKIFQKPIARMQEAILQVSSINHTIPMKSSDKAPDILQWNDISDELSTKFSHKFKQGYVCICLESAWKYKQWHASRFLEVAKKIQKKKLGIIWVGLKSLPLGIYFKDTIDLTGRLTLPEITCVLKEAKLLICNDSGLMHLAEAVNTPVVAIFGPTSYELGFAPQLKTSQIVEADLWCRPCSKTGRWCTRPIQRWKCLSDVHVEQVFDVTEQVLQEVS